MSCTSPATYFQCSCCVADSCDGQIERERETLKEQSAAVSHIAFGRERSIVNI